MAIGSPSAFFSASRERVMGRPLAGGAWLMRPAFLRSISASWASGGASESPFAGGWPPTKGVFGGGKAPKHMVVDQPGPAHPGGHGQERRAVHPLDGGKVGRG